MALGAPGCCGLTMLISSWVTTISGLAQKYCPARGVLGSAQHLSHPRAPPPTPPRQVELSLIPPSALLNSLCPPGPQPTQPATSTAPPRVAGFLEGLAKLQLSLCLLKEFKPSLCRPPPGPDPEPRHSPPRQPKGPGSSPQRGLGLVVSLPSVLEALTLRSAKCKTIKKMLPKMKFLQ